MNNLPARFGRALSSLDEKLSKAKGADIEGLDDGIGRLSDRSSSSSSSSDISSESEQDDMSSEDEEIDDEL